LTQDNSKLTHHEHALNRIAVALEGLKYGTLQITVHNSKVTQIDKVERTRILKENFVDVGGDIFSF